MKSVKFLVELGLCLMLFVLFVDFLIGLVKKESQTGELRQAAKLAAASRGAEVERQWVAEATTRGPEAASRKAAVDRLAASQKAAVEIAAASQRAIDEAKEVAERAKHIGKLPAWMAAQEVVKRDLRSPSTADFGSVSSLWGEHQDYMTAVTKHDDGTYTCRGWVDAQNGFGATVRTNFVVKIRPNGDWDHWLLVDGPYLTPR